MLVSRNWALDGTTRARIAMVKTMRLGDDDMADGVFHTRRNRAARQNIATVSRSILWQKALKTQQKHGCTISPRGCCCSAVRPSNPHDTDIMYSMCSACSVQIR